MTFQHIEFGHSDEDQLPLEQNDRCLRYPFTETEIKALTRICDVTDFLDSDEYLDRTQGKHQFRGFSSDLAGLAFKC